LPYLVDGLHKNGKDPGKSSLMKSNLLVKRVNRQRHHLNRPTVHKISKFPKIDRLQL
jgi:hypothetical protein